MKLGRWWNSSYMWLAIRDTGFRHLHCTKHCIFSDLFTYWRSENRINLNTYPQECYIKHNVRTSHDIIHPFTYHNYKEYVSRVLKNYLYYRAWKWELGKSRHCHDMEIKRREIARERGPRCNNETERSRRMETGDELMSQRTSGIPYSRLTPVLPHSSNLCIHICPSPKSPVMFRTNAIPATSAQYSSPRAKMSFISSGTSWPPVLVCSYSLSLGSEIGLSLPSFHKITEGLRDLFPLVTEHPLIQRPGLCFVNCSFYLFSKRGWLFDAYATTGDCVCTFPICATCAIACCLCP